MEPAWTERSVEELADRLVLARGEEPCEEGRCKAPGSWGRAVFLVGAGCSVSADIPLGAEVARRCAVHLARIYEAHDRGTEAAPRGFEPEEALSWLVENRRVRSLKKPDGDPNWGAYYGEFFDNHLASINRQREFFDEIIREADGKLNWAHVCLGELVKRRYAHTVLTTNFDQLVLQGIIRAGLLPVVADGLESLNRVTAEPRRPQVVHLHGSMHTYDPRNSRAAIMATRRDPTLRSMLYTLLHRCDLLVVVGYAGGEEGVMELLCEAARQLPPLNVFWVLREQSSPLSPGAEKLMNIGDNKHVVRCADADKLFQIIMNRLKIGEPDWLKDPVSTLTAQSSKLALPRDREVAKAIQRFMARVEHADDRGRREDEPAEALDALRIAGRYREVIERLDADPDVGSNAELLRIRATTNFNLVQEAGAGGGPMGEVDKKRLRSAIDDLKACASGTAVPDRLEAHRQLFEALMLSSEQLEDAEALDDVITRADAVEELYREGDTDDAIAVRLLVAQARQQRAETAGDDKSGYLEGARRDFEGVLEMLKGKSRERRWIECKEGLATTLQLLAAPAHEDDGASSNADAAFDMLDGAVVHLRDVLLANLGVRSLDQAGRLKNLAAMLVERARLKPETRLALQDAQTYLEQAIAIYASQDGDRDLLAIASQELAGLRRSLAT